MLQTVTNTLQPHVRTNSNMQLKQACSMQGLKRENIHALRYLSWTWIFQPLDTCALAIPVYVPVSLLGLTMTADCQYWLSWR